MKWTHSLAVLAFALTTITAHAVVTLPFYDGFNYTSGGDLAGNSNWVSASGSSTIKVGAANLAYAALTNGIGKDVTLIPGGTAARTYVNFTSQNTNTVFFSFLLKLNSLPSAQSIVGFASSSTSSDTTPSLGFFIKPTTGQLAVGINTSTPQFSSANLNLGQNYFIVVGYTFGATDTADVWIDPASLGGNAPAMTGSFSGTHNASLAYFLWNTASGGGGSFEVDEFRIGANYASVTPPSAATPPPATNSVPRITQNFINGGSFILRGINGTPNGGYEILCSSNVALPLAQWSVVGSNTFNGSGNFDCTNPLAGNAARNFYRLRVGGTNVTVAVAPTITNQPQNQLVLLGQDALFSVGVSGTAPLSYQWFFNTNTPLAGATSASLLMTNVQATNVGGYSVGVTNIAGSATSVVATLTLGAPPTNGDFYVSPTGNDANPGTLAAPFFTIQKAVSLVAPSNTIYVRGGTYFYTDTIHVTNSGTANGRIKLWAYPGEHPLLDFTNQPYADANRGFLVTTNGNYWHFKGLEIARAGDNAIKVEGSHNIFELLVLHDNGDTGLQIGFAHTTSNDGSMGSSNLVLNCDSYHNYDSATRGGNADGFACKLHPGAGNVFIGCRAWFNSDDAWDLFESDSTIVISNCWAWHSGDKNLFPASSSFGGNGNGFKLGGNGSGGSSRGTHLVMNCVGFNCSFQNTSANGFTDNSHGDGEILLNCVGFGCNYNFFFEQSVNGGKTNIFKNCASFSPSGSTAGYSFGTGSVIQQNDSWTLPVIASAADFNSTLESAAAAPRNPDGTLPSGFARLVTGSDLIDQGVDVGIPFNGSAPDLGAHEFAP